MNKYKNIYLYKFFFAFFNSESYHSVIKKGVWCKFSKQKTSCTFFENSIDAKIFEVKIDWGLIELYRITFILLISYNQQLKNYFYVNY